MWHNLWCVALAVFVSASAKSAEFTQKTPLTTCDGAKCEKCAKNGTNVHEQSEERKNECASTTFFERLRERRWHKFHAERRHAFWHRRYAH